jgi:photosystem II stability/assembly factor-like uncharacterized protein
MRIAQEIHAPSDCEHVLQLDVRRTVAFGDRCGVFLSNDRGGVWRNVSQSLGRTQIGAFAEGRGGFLTAQIAWRLDGGIWWTFDGGQHWRPFHSSDAPPLERGVFVNSRQGVFATNNGWVVATHDGGRNWTYILRGDVERIAAANRAVMVTTAQSVRVSPDGGRTWLAPGAETPTGAVQPSLEVVGTRRSIALAPSVRVSQHDDRLVMEGSGGAVEEIARGIPAGFTLVAAHATRASVDRVLLDGGIVLARERED